MKIYLTKTTIRSLTKRQLGNVCTLCYDVHNNENPEYTNAKKWKRAQLLELALNAAPLTISEAYLNK